MIIRIVVFELSGYRYAIPMADAREFARVPSIVPLPKAPAIVEGVVNIHGKVVPVLDIRKRFRLPEKRAHPMDHLVIAHADRRLVALRVDRVLGVEDVDARDIEDAAAVTPEAEYLTGVAKLADGLVLIHDLRAFLAEAEARELDEALAVPSEVVP